MSNYFSIAFLGIPTNWNLNLRAYLGGTCARVQQSRNHLGTTFACLQQSQSAITGGQYSFNGKKRDIIELDEPEQCVDTGNKCDGIQRPNEVGFEDGVKYDLTLLDEAAADEILAIIATGGTSAEVAAAHSVAKI